MPLLDRHQSPKRGELRFGVSVVAKREYKEVKQHIGVEGAGGVDKAGAEGGKGPYVISRRLAVWAAAT